MRKAKVSYFDISDVTSVLSAMGAIVEVLLERVWDQTKYVVEGQKKGLSKVSRALLRSDHENIRLIKSARSAHGAESGRVLAAVAAPFSHA